MNTILADLPPTRVWDINSLRFTLFFDTPPLKEVQVLFSEFYGFEPEESSSRLMELRSDASAVKSTLGYKVDCNGVRADFVVTAYVNPAALDAGFPVLVGSKNLFAMYLESARAISVKRGTAVRRVALSTQFVSSVADKSEGYKLLQRYVPGLHLDDNCSDFQYRINRPRKSGENNQVTINRLATWSCLSCSVANPDQEGAKLDIGTVIAVFTDINTSPSEDFSALSSNVRTEVIESLFRFTDEIPNKGDVP